MRSPAHSGEIVRECMALCDFAIRAAFHVIAYAGVETK